MRALGTGTKGARTKGTGTKGTGTKGARTKGTETKGGETKGTDIKGTVYVAVVGSGTASREEAEVAEVVGRHLGEAGAVVVCGGLGGVMEAACRGAVSAGGQTVGILPGTDRAEANDHVGIALATGMGEARNALVAGTADAVVAVGGEFGTLSEIALALKAGKAVVGLGTWELARAGAPVAGVVPAADPAEAARLALEEAARWRRSGRSRS